MNTIFENCIFFFKKITFDIFKGMKTTPIPEIVFHTFIDDDTSLIEKYNTCLIRNKTISD